MAYYTRHVTFYLMKKHSEKTGFPVVQVKTFAVVLREERDRLHLTQTITAILLDIPFRTYWAWENAESEPPKVAQEGVLARLKKVKI